MSQFNVAVLTPSTGVCRMEYAQSLARLVAYFAQNRVREECPEQHLITWSIMGSGIAANYEQMVRHFLGDAEIHWTHFLSIEDDMMFPWDGLHRLASHREAIVGANYSTNKGDPLRFTAAPVDPSKRLLTTAESIGIEEVGLLPQGFTLVAREVYEALEPPWYATGMQDYRFSRLAREAGFRLYVDHDVSKQIKHIGPHLYSYEDALRDERRPADGE